MIKLIASDLDGSLLNEQKQLPAELNEILLKLHARGIRFVAASGRSLYTVLDNFKNVPVNIGFLCDNGAVVYYDGQVLYDKPLSSELVLKTLKVLEHIPNVCALLCGKTKTYRKQGVKGFENHIDPYYIHQCFVPDLAAITEPIYKIAICDELTPALNAYPVLHKALGNIATLQISGQVWMDVMAPSVNKGDGIKVLQNLWNISRQETMAFGDFYNDISLLQNAEYSFVMKNANEDMRKYGNYLAEKNSDNGVIKAIKKYVLQE